MDKRKIVDRAREKVREQNDSAPSGQKSLLGDVIGAIIDIVGDSSDNDSAENSSARTSGKESGRKPQSQSNGRIAGVGRSVADQLHRKK